MKLKILLISILAIICSKIATAQLPPSLISEAEAGNSEAQFELGLCYYYGEYVSQDYSLAIEWWTKAANQNHIKAQTNLGIYYINTKQYNMAVPWLNKAAAAGNIKAQRELAECHCFGLGVPKNTTNAIKWWTKAAEQGDAPSQFNLGIAYIKGDDIEQNIELAKFWLQKAAQQGHTDAANLLDRILKSGH